MILLSSMAESFESHSASFLTWLRSVRSFVADNSATGVPDGVSVLVVLPNEAVDLDSVVSSIAYAFTLHRAYAAAADAATSAAPAPLLSALRAGACRAGERVVVIPVLPISAEDLSLRGDSEWALTRLLATYTDAAAAAAAPTVAGADTDGPLAPQAAFVFADSAMWSTWVSSPRFSLALTDHNQPTVAPFAAAAAARPASVCAVIDHHADAGFFAASAAPRLVRPVGSASSALVLALAGQMLFSSPSTVEAEIGAAEVQAAAVAASAAHNGDNGGVSVGVSVLRSLLPCVYAGPPLPPVAAVADDDASAPAAAATPSTSAGAGIAVSTSLSGARLALGDALCAAVITDTINMAPAARKVTAGDAAALALLGHPAWATAVPAPATPADVGGGSNATDGFLWALQPVRVEPPASAARDALYEWVQERRRDTSRLSVGQLLRVDLKWARAVITAGAAAVAK